MRMSTTAQRVLFPCDDTEADERLMCMPPAVSPCVDTEADERVMCMPPAVSPCVDTEADERVMCMPPAAQHVLFSCNDSRPNEKLTIPSNISAITIPEITMLSLETTDDSVFQKSQEDLTQTVLSSSSKPNSPIHSQRTPVTENDPLGLFLVESKNDDISFEATSLMPETSERTKMKLQKAVSFDSNDISSESEKWKPLNQSSAENNHEQLNQESKNNGQELGASTSSFDRSWSRRSRAMMQRESITKAWKYTKSTASMFSNKFTELKQNITPLKGPHSVSNTSLPLSSEEASQQESTKKTRHTGSLDDLDEAEAVPEPSTSTVTSLSVGKLNKYGGYGKTMI